jgi:hypothetical protein
MTCATLFTKHGEYRLTDRESCDAALGMCMSSVFH